MKIELLRTFTCANMHLNLTIVIVVLIEHIMVNGQYDTLQKFENLLLIFEFLMWCWSFWLFYDSSNKYAFWFSTAH